MTAMTAYSLWSDLLLQNASQKRDPPKHETTQRECDHHTNARYDEALEKGIQRDAV
jgi:hypothetical protein